MCTSGASKMFFNSIFDENFFVHFKCIINILLSGFARVENAEFYHMGQEGYINYEDPRFALSYLNTGTVSNIKPSYIIRRVCAAVIIELQLLFAAFSWDCIAFIEACSLRQIV